MKLEDIFIRQIIFNFKVFLNFLIFNIVLLINAIQIVILNSNRNEEIFLLKECMTVVIVYS